MTINERIKIARKAKGYSQNILAKKLGVAQTSVSFMEQIGNTVPDKNIKSISLILGLNEDWLRFGKDPMYMVPSLFSLDKLAIEKGATKVDLEIVKSYFELDPNIRKAIINFWKQALRVELSSETQQNDDDIYNSVPITPDVLEEEYPPIGENKADIG